MVPMLSLEAALCMVGGVFDQGTISRSEHHCWKFYNATPSKNKYMRVRSREQMALYNPYFKSRRLMVVEGSYNPSK